MKNAVIAAIVAAIISVSGAFAATGGFTPADGEQNARIVALEYRVKCLERGFPRPVFSYRQVAGYNNVSRATLYMRYLDCRFGPEGR